MIARIATGFLLLAMAGAGCVQHRPVSQQELVAYVNNKSHELVKTGDSKGIHVQVSYRPSSLLVLQELEEPQKKDTTVIKRLEKKYNRQYYFVLKFSKDKKEAIRELGGFNRYSDMLQVFAFYMQQNINLTSPPHDTIPLADYFFDQTFGTSDGNSILISFDKSELIGKKTVDINIAECGLGIGDMKFRFDVADLESVPSLDYSLMN